ncbi:MAG: hypothetical protein OEV49_07785 [candidate division Zixibacteria bacterium]|nr:hypothetical protein [candidate division Zixibacteria bacterium]MDH4035579.1 hypothetical protein [candidate division Zixibacteria bacterium]
MWEFDADCTVLVDGSPRVMKVRIAKSVWQKANAKSRTTALTMLKGITIPLVRVWETGLRFDNTQHRWVLNTGFGHQFESSIYGRTDEFEIDFSYWR